MMRGKLKAFIIGLFTAVLCLVAPMAAFADNGSAGGVARYQVEFTYGQTQHVLPGDSSAPLSEILDHLGLCGEVASVEVSNESLFSASCEDGEWVVTAHKAFTSEEWIRVTIDGVTYEIKVTDSELDQYRYYYWSTTLSTYEIVSNIGIDEEESLLGYLCFLCNGSTYNFTWDGDYPIRVPASEEAIPWNANITGKTLTIRNADTNEVVYTGTLSGDNNAWKISYDIGAYVESDYTQIVLYWEQTKIGTSTVTYDKNCDDSAVEEPASATVPRDTNPGQHASEFPVSLPGLTREGYTFDGWYTDPSGGTRVGGSGAIYKPTGNVTLYAHWKGTPVTVDFGEGHEDYVAEKFSEIDGFTVDGATVTFGVPSTATIEEAYNLFKDEIDPIASDVDNDELFMNDIALKPASDYASDDEVREERGSYAERTIGDGITLYAQWAKPVGAVSVTIVAPTPGTVIYEDVAALRSNPGVEATVNGNATLDADSARDWTQSNYKGYFTGEVADGQSCYARLFLNAKYGYYFASFGDDSLIWAKDTSVAVTNATGVEVSPSYWDSAEVHGTVWAGSAEEPTKYNVSVDEGTELGKVSAYPLTAHEGDTVNIEVTPNDGCVLKTLAYTPEGGEAVSIDVVDGLEPDYSFTMPAANVTVSATFDLENMVYVDFGEGHEDFAQALCGDDEDFNVNGAVVSFQYVDTATDTYNAHVAYDAFKNNLDPDRSVDPVDDGACYMNDIALNTRSHYTNEDELRNEHDSYWLESIRDGITFHALWADPLEDATITVTPPECGTEVTVKWYKSATQAQPAPQLAVEGNCHLDDYQLNYSDWDLSEHGVRSVGDSLVMKGGNSYKATGYLSSDWGYFIPEGTDALTIEGGTLENTENHGPYKVGFAISVPVSHKYADDADVVEPTCTEDGSRTYMCQACGDKVVETLEATGHDWGEWAVTKPATRTEEGEEARTCSRDASHVETRAIPKLDPSNVTYRVVQGDGAKWAKNSGATLTFVFKRNVNDGEAFSHFVGIRLDGAIVDASNYTAEPGSVVVTLNASYLEGLATGTHTLEALFNDGSSTAAEFTVEAAQYAVTVAGGTADKTTATAGETVTITADEPEAGHAFVQWAIVDGVDFGNASSASTTFIMPAKDVTATAVFAPIVIGDIEDKVYTGSPIEPTDEVKVSLSGVDIVLTADDYEVSFDDNVDAGTATATVTMKSPRAGSATTTFKILPADISGAEVTATGQVYDGTELKSTPTVTWNGKTLTADDYTPSYSGNVNAGQATITVTGKGNFTGTASGAFTIAPRPVTITVNSASKIQGEDDPAFTGTVEGLVADGDLGEVSYKRTNDDEAPGTYEGVLTATYAENANYDVSVTNGDFTIKRQLTVTWLDGDGSVLQTKTYGEGDEPPAYDGRTPTKAATAQYTYAFAGWDDGTVDGTTTTYKPLFSETVKTATLTFDLVGGTLDGKTGTITIEANVGDTIKLPAAPTRDGYTFKCWKGSEYKAGAEYVVPEGGHEFTAEWEKNDGGKSSDTKPAIPATGDNNGALVLMLSFAALGSLCILAASIIKRRRDS